MLNVQRYLHDGNTIESLVDFGIDAKYSADGRFVILDYDQIASIPFRNHPYVIECRGLILRTDDYSIVIKSFDRLFNFGEIDNVEKLIMMLISIGLILILLKKLMGQS